ncbi:hypothetical protein ACLB2K_007033 [Fragaria x ananassa]
MQRPQRSIAIVPNQARTDSPHSGPQRSIASLPNQARTDSPRSGRNAQIVRVSPTKRELTGKQRPTTLRQSRQPSAN